MRRIVLAVCAAFAASTLIGILLGAYIHEIGVNSERARRPAPDPSTTVSTTVRTVTIRVTVPRQAAQSRPTYRPEPVLARRDAAHVKHPGGDPATPTGAPPTTSDTPTTTAAAPTTTTTPPPAPTSPAVPCRVGHRAAAPNCSGEDPPAGHPVGHPDPHNSPRS